MDVACNVIDSRTKSRSPLDSEGGGGRDPRVRVSPHFPRERDTKGASCRCTTCRTCRIEVRVDFAVVPSRRRRLIITFTLYGHVRSRFAESVVPPGAVETHARLVSTVTTPLHQSSRTRTTHAPLTLNSRVSTRGGHLLMHALCESTLR